MASSVSRPGFLYWNRRSKEDESQHERIGTVVVLGWMLSRRKHLAPYARLYHSCGWDSLVCHPDVFNLWFPSRATTFSLNVLDELVKELEEHPGPVVFAVFSGAHKACLYKIIQILLGTCDGVDGGVGKFEVIKRSLAGMIFDSSPVDFVSEIGVKFVNHQVLSFKRSRPITIISWGTYALGKALDTLFARQFGVQRIDLWHTLYSSVKIGPILFLCSENDKLAPIETVHMFASNLQKLGGDVKIVSWRESEHVGHFRFYPEQYANAVRNLLLEAGSLFSRRFAESVTDTSSPSNESVGNTEGSFVPYDGAAAAWTNLPEAIVTEIKRLSKLPHIQFNGRHKNLRQPLTPAISGVSHGISFQNCSESEDVLEWVSFQDEIVALRSRL